MVERARDLVFVTYQDHVLFNRSSALAVRPQVREAVGWLVYDCDCYVTISWDRDAEPPTLKGGDAKASGLVLLKTDIIKLTKLPLQKISEWQLNSPQTIVRDEYALKPNERKTRPSEKEKTET